MSYTYSLWTEFVLMVHFGFKGWDSRKKPAGQGCKGFIIQMIIPNRFLSRIEDLTFEFTVSNKVVPMVYFFYTRQNWMEPIRNSKTRPIRRPIQLYKDDIRTYCTVEKVTGPFEIALIQEFTNLSKTLVHLRISSHTLYRMSINNYYSATVLYFVCSNNIQDIKPMNS